MKSLILSCSALVLLVGCCPKPEPTIQYVDRVVETKVPVKCVVEMPKFPVAGQNTAESTVNIKEWVMLVAEAVKRCK